MIYVGPKSFRQNKVLVEELASAFPEDSLSEFPLGCTAAIIGLDRVDKTFLYNYPTIKFISKYGVGMDNIDLEECKRQWVRVLWTPGVNASYVAEHTLGLMISLMRKIHEPIWHDQTGNWVKPKGQSLEHSLIGVVGAGHVGNCVLRLVRAQGALTVANDIASGSTIDKETLFGSCDIITLHVPLTPETKHMINAKTLAMMKPTAYLINTSRGAVVDEEALIYALKNKIIAGAALDVFEHEPYDGELLRMENVICTPHIAGNSEQAILAMGRAAIENLKRMVEP